MSAIDLLAEDDVESILPDETIPPAEAGDVVGQLPPLTEEEWARVLKGRKRTFRILVKPEQRDWAANRAKNCGECANVRMHGDPRRGFCLAQGVLIGPLFPVLCRTFKPNVVRP